MPVPAYMEIVGRSQGSLHSGCMSPESVGTLSKADKIDMIQVQAFKKRIILPRDPQSGQPSGKRVHEGFTITKVFDRSTPMLQQALAKGEQLQRVTIKWYRTAQGGYEEHYFTHEFEDATIVEINQYMPNCLDPQFQSFTHMEDVTITYKRVSWSHIVSGTEGFDSWDGG